MLQPWQKIAADCDNKNANTESQRTFFSQEHQTWLLQEASYTLESANLFFHRNAGGGFFRRPPTLNLLEDFALLYAAALASLSAADEASASYSACQNAQIGRGSTCCGSEVEEDASERSHRLSADLVDLVQLCFAQCIQLWLLRIVFLLCQKLTALPLAYTKHYCIARNA